MAHTLRRINCRNSGYTRFSIYPTPSRYKGRHRKNTTSPEQLAAIAKNNSKLAQKNFICYVVENFIPEDYCVTLTFPSSTVDEVRYREMKKCIERLRYHYNKHDAKLKFILVWGRGEMNNMLHCHILINSHPDIIYNDLWAAVNKYNCKSKQTTHNYHIQKIRNKYGRRSKIDTMKATAYYLIKHWSTLLPEDDQIIKRRWYKSNSVSRPLDDRLSDKFNEADDLPISPTMMMKKLRHAKEYGSLDEMIEKLFPEYIKFPMSQVHLYQDFIGRWHFEIELIRKNSPFDECNSKTQMTSADFLSWCE